MKRTIHLLLILISGLVACSFGGEKAEVSPDMQRLETEYGLAANQSMYVILDPGQSLVSLKIKGVVLREWKMNEVRTWGVLATDEVLSLLGKTAIMLPEREQIQPGDTTIVARDAFDIQALELVDMPTSFTLLLEKNIEMYVRPEVHGYKSLPKILGREFHWRALLPLRTVLRTVRKESPFSAISCVLESKEDVQALFWTLNEKTKFLIVPSDPK